MNPATLIAWCVIGALLLVIVVRVAILIARVLAPAKRDEEHQDSPFYTPRR